MLIAKYGRVGLSFFYYSSLSFMSLNYLQYSLHLEKLKDEKSRLEA
jgi:hypothetical protein